MLLFSSALTHEVNMSRATNRRRPRAASLSKSKTKLRSVPKFGESQAGGGGSFDAGGERGLTAFGERLVMTLQSKGMSDSELAKALGIAQPNIHTLKYKTDRPRHKTVVKIAKALGVTPDALLPQSTLLGAQTAAEGTKVYLVIESKQGRQTIRLA
jgi:transcriptional regulator with XRE-family HTH domain